MTDAGKCVFCGEPISVLTDYRQVVGWERIQRSAGGTNAIRLPDRTSQRFACRFCVDRQASGLAAAQQALPV
jgi:hypothetical protein